MRSGLQRWWTLALLLVLAGCGGSGAVPVQVSGKVEYDGKPLPDGEVHFMDMDTGKPAEMLLIKNGAFAGTVTAGKKQLRFYAYRPGKPPPPNTPGATNEPTKENYIRALYNEQSNIIEEVKPGGTNVFDQKLLSK